MSGTKNLTRVADFLRAAIYLSEFPGSILDSLLLQFRQMTLIIF